MVEKQSPTYGESYYPVQVGQGLYTSELPSNIPDGFSAQVYNFVATGDSLENRIGITRPSVNWSMSINFRMPDDSGVLVRNSSNIELVWGSWDNVTSKMHFIKEPTVAGPLNYTEVILPARVRGIGSYQGFVYFILFDANRVYRINTINWTTGAVTYLSVPSAAAIPATIGLWAFKDRFWTSTSNQLFFTEIAALGASGPETWAATNYIRFDANTGRAIILKVVPLSNKLIVFTTAGVFSLLVEGEPSSWILRILDSESQSTSRMCAFEAKGVVYYANTQGVWATNGQSIAKLSGVIEDQFFLAKGTRIQSVHPYEDGILVSIAKLTSTGFYDAPNCRIFYSKLDPVGWSEWNIENGDGTTNAFGDNRICDIHSITAKLPTALNAEPTVYMIASISDSREGATQNMRPQLLVFDGGSNKLLNRAGVEITAPVSCVLKTKFMDGGNPLTNKVNKECKIEVFTSDSLHEILTSWDLDSTVGASTRARDKITNEFTVGTATNLIRIPTDFMFRRCALTLSAKLQSETSQFKIKDITLVLAKSGPEAEIAR